MDTTQRIQRSLADLSGSQAHVSAELWRDYARTYSVHLLEDRDLDVDAECAAAQIAAHLGLGVTRDADEDLVCVTTPQAGADALVTVAGSTLVQIVTTDRPYLVDTVAMEVRRQGWTLRRLEHPQVGVRRDRTGRIAAVTRDGHGESWQSLEVYPSLGVSAEAAGHDLEEGLREAIAAVRLVDADRVAMELRARQLAEGSAEQPAADVPGSDAAEVARTRELLHWLLDGHFMFLGYEEFDVRDGAFTAVPGTALGIRRDGAEETFHADPVGDDQRLLVITKHPHRATVYCPVYLDYVGVRRYDAAGVLVGERRFLGLLSASAYTESIDRTPVLASKVEELLECSGYGRGSYGWNEVWRVVDSYPRDELFGATVEELAPIVRAVATLRLIRLVRTYLRRDRYGRFVTALVYLPRDRSTTESAEAVSQILLQELGGESIEHTAWSDESSLTRLFFRVKLRADAPADVDAALVHGLVEEAVTTWDDRMDALLSGRPAQLRGVDCGQAYPQAYTPQDAVADLAVANTLDGPDDLRYSLERANGGMRFKIFAHRELELHELLPMLADLDARVDDEQPFTWRLRGRLIHLYDFGLRLPSQQYDDDARRRFVDAFDAVYRGRSESDQYNKLVLAAGLTWQQVTWLRAIGRYLKQARIGFSQDYIAACLLANPALATDLVRAFGAKFDPDARGDWEGALARAATAVDQVASLDHDRILRGYLAFIAACTRTNAFAPASDGDIEWALAFKIAAQGLQLLPEPRPKAEIFVYSPRVTGVHLRFGAVARGGLRWSDRSEDFRTEVLGLVKAQTVKNAVIVPVGAKGGFVPQHLPDPADRAAWTAEGTACYRIFVAALLSLTDDIVDGQVRRPGRVVAHDGDDPYLVVAADKGTASFSDIANEISARRGFWLKDAFASGGSVGYDHKAMGITAAGTWEAVKRHFAELGTDPQTTDFTCVGIGDMSGDVFGNGMLSSEHIRLVAAFDHRHVFIDPDPDPATSFAERKRLFELPGSAWSDYDAALLSAGGGVFPRSLKAIPISPQAARALGLPGTTEALTPNEVVSAILRAPVDLLYNGGIGTYVKASYENHEQAGDRANDAVRVNGDQVRARCAAEGGNLGWTQAARIEYALSGGAINTDFIDNSAGVDCSDHEVNIKILLADAIAAGLLPDGERDGLLASMTDDVAAGVLGHNVAQNLALSNAVAQAEEMAAQHIGWMGELESAGLLDRSLESLPTDAQLEERMAQGRGLTRPELAVLLAHTKIALTDRVLETDLPEDATLADRLTEYFPPPLRSRFRELMPGHRLAREIVTTVAVNRFVDLQGITAFHRLSRESGAGPADVLRAQLAARAVLAVGPVEELLAGCGGLDATVATGLRLELRRTVEGATRWLLHNRRGRLDVAATIAEFSAPVAAVRGALQEVLTARQLAAGQERFEHWVGEGVPAELARRLATAGHEHLALAVAQVARRLDADPVAVAKVHGRVAAALGLDALDQKVAALPRRARWDELARSVLRDELLDGQAELTLRAVTDAGPHRLTDPDAVVKAWTDSNPGARQYARVIGEACEGPADMARMTVGIGAVLSVLGSR